MKKLKKKAKKLFTLCLNSVYFFFYHRVPLDEHLVFLESRDGKDFTGNILRIAEALSTGEYGDFKMVARVDKSIIKRAKHLSETYNLRRIRFTTKRSISLLVMEHAKYIVSDSGVPWKYVKKDGQIVLNTWHGTPLKHMGSRISSEKHAIGTVQHFFLSSDFFLCPSSYIRETMLHDYMVENVMSGKALMTGYPRNAVFFDDERRNKLRSEFELQDKRVYAYMPTWRGHIKSIKTTEQVEEFCDILSELDARLQDDQIVFAKLHPFIASHIDYAQFLRIKPFPSAYDTYDILNLADCLITDYSSVFFDFANTRRKIILFAYDKEEYCSDRGMYLELDDLPFPTPQDTESLVIEMGNGKNYSDAEFLQTYCTHDSKRAIADVCNHVFAGKNSCAEVAPGNGKENVLIMGGGLAKNGITSALCNLLSSIDLNQRNYYVSFRRWEIDAEPTRINSFPDSTQLLPLMSRKALTLREHFAYKKFLQGKFSEGLLPSLVKRALDRELNRCYYGVSFTHAIQFDGYNDDSILLFSRIKNARRIIYVHNDMVREIATRKNQRESVLRYAYRAYDQVAIVSADLREPTSRISGRNDNIVTIHNVHNYKNVLERAKQPIDLQPSTVIRSWNAAGIEGVLESSGKKIVSIGRFSPEKGHERLLRAFNEYHRAHPDDQLIIIGGLGWLFDRTVNLASKLECWKNVTLIKTLENPMPILSRCDLLILSSLYEGLPVVIAEADTLGVPVVSTDIVALQGFMRDHDGFLVESSQEGICEGLLAFADGKVHPMNIDFEAYNREALATFETLMKR